MSRLHEVEVSDLRELAAETIERYGIGHLTTPERFAGALERLMPDAIAACRPGALRRLVDELEERGIEVRRVV